MKDADPTTTPARPSAVAAAPVLTTVVPATGPAAGNNNVVLNGNGFTGTTAVTFGPKAALGYNVGSPTQITAIAPSGTGSVAVTVKTPGGTSNAVTYTYAAAPSLTAITPSQGPSSGGTTVTLTGSGFTAATAVTFGTTAATSYTVNSPTQITATAPPGTGAAPVTVTTPGGSTGPVYFFYLSAPSLITLTPSQGPSSGGTVVTLAGSGFTGTTAVIFGDTAATSLTVNSPTQITATAPPGTGAAPVTVTTPGGTSNPVVYTYAPPPVITGLSPAQGPTSAGAGITLTGSGLTTATTVRFGTLPAAFTVLSDTAVVALAPAAPAGPVLVDVITLGGTSNALPYTRLSPPGI
ncbi:IPT/TIG domain-containing protein [Streptomyces sp. NPDC087894]|uniref:IPT/TIG domain-containing protein n=1 Tax=Streptomyces sp. NPDC087894 TaxID=3365816 RepID=UPI0037F26F2A